MKECYIVLVVTLKSETSGFRHLLILIQTLFTKVDHTKGQYGSILPHTTPAIGLVLTELSRWIE